MISIEEVEDLIELFNQKDIKPDSIVLSISQEEGNFFVLGEYKNKVIEKFEFTKQDLELLLNAPRGFYDLAQECDIKNTDRFRVQIKKIRNRFIIDK